MFSSELTRNAPPGPALELSGLCKSYRQGFWSRRGQPAVQDLDLTVQPGEIFALLGHNGAGKTTTLKAILGLVRPDAGSITICGQDAGRPEARARVGYLPEAPYFHENLTAAELLEFHGKLLGLDRARRHERTGICLQMVGMERERRRRLGECSKGQRQRLGLAQALLGEPDLLILDEPQSGLDPLGRREVRDIMLEQKRRGVTIIFSSHIVPDVEAVADRVAMLSCGRLQEIKDLNRRPPARDFSVWVSPPPAEIGRSWQTQPDLHVQQQEMSRWQILASSPGALGRLLTDCDRHGLGIFDLQQQGGGLEEDFLGSLLSSRPQPEVASC
jgi:ABC-2 type transport system ATP-binding protein